ncbi:MAG: alpha/beta fold hydrolase [Candidatus Hodarchaeales archaeon]|jgi:pimeloyl-ACP methyl ester carboxylesterase
MTTEAHTKRIGPILTKKLATKFGNLHYLQTVKKEEDFVILFIHGLGGNKKWFSSHYGTYKLGEFTWIIPDLIGHGESSKQNLQEAYSMNNQASLLHQLLINENVKSLIILAHSMGGPVAISLIEQITERINQKINVLSLFYLEGNLDENDTFFSSQIAKHSYEEFEKRFDFWIEKLHKNIEGEFVTELQKIGPFPLWASSVDLVSISLSNQLLPRLQSALKKSNFPVYFIYGGKNKGLFSSQTLVKKAQLPLIFIPEAGHVMFDDNPDAFWKTIKRALLLLKDQ